MNETELLFTEVLNCDRASLYLNRQKTLDKNISSKISQVLKRRICGEPIAYILGKCEFMEGEFIVNKDVFIPRPETEILVEVVIRQLSALPAAAGFAFGRSPQLSACKILEIGTGSGCIAISLAKFLPRVKIVATDISEAALKVARENARLNNLDGRIKFIQNNLFEGSCLNGLRGLGAGYNIIVSNPPYIPKAEIRKLAVEIQYEPVSSLDGGQDGLDFYRHIIQESPGFLKKGGLLILEMGFDQCESIKEIFKFCEKFQVKEVIKDYNSIDRVIVATRK
jgi:release factor glutamine methyltransferase